MPETATPRTVLDYVGETIDELPPAARLVVVFDPYADLALGDTFITAGTGRGWCVLRYDGNDLAFRKQQAGGTGDSNLI